MSRPAERFRAAVEETVRRRRMLKGGERVVVATSGGPDSLALLGVLRQMAADWDLSLHVAHFDHRLRAGSAADAAYVARLARRWSLPVTVGSAPPEPPPAGLSPEEAARHRRLSFLEGVAAATAADRIATGHTLDDQAETVLMRLLLGAGTRGVAGIPPVRGAFIRPLIERRRSETEAFCRSLGLRPRRDPTNADPAFLRNLIRREVIPLLAGLVNARVAEALARHADIARDEDDLLDLLASEAIEAEATPAGVRLPLDVLGSLPIALRRRAVRLALPQPGTSHAHLERILELADQGRSGDAIDLGRGLKASIEYGSLLIGRSLSPAPPVRAVRLVVPGRTDLASWGASATVWEERDPPSSWPDGRGTCVIDADRLIGPLVVRAPRRGDRFAPLGMTGTRAVSDVLAEAKVPRDERMRVPVVTSGDEIVWVVGHRLGEHAKVTDRTRRFLWMTFEGGSPWRS